MTLLQQPAEAESMDYEIVEVTEKEEKTELQHMLEELGVASSDDAMIKVYRVNDAGKEAHCFDTLPEGLEQIEDRLRDSYGKGDYKLKIFMPNAQGRKSLKKVAKMSIEVPLNMTQQPEQKEEKTDVAAIMQSVAQTMADNNLSIMNAMKEQQLEMQIRMQETLLQVVSNKPESPNMFEMFRLFKDLQPEQRDVFGEFRAFTEFQRELKEDMPPPDNSTLGTLTTGLNSLMKLAADAPKPAVGPKVSAQPAQKPMPNQPVTQPGQPIPAQIAQPPGATPLPGPQPPQQGQPMNQDLIQAIVQQQIMMLIEKAKEDKDPETYARLIIEEMPPQYYPELLNRIGDSNEFAFANFSTINPAINNYPEWFAEFFDIIREAFDLAHEQSQQLDEAGLTPDSTPGDDTLNTNGMPNNAGQSSTIQTNDTNKGNAERNTSG